MTNPLGQGVAFPLAIGANGRLSWSAGEDNIRQSIAVILKTNLGERVALPRFGGGLQSMLFEPNNAATHTRIAHNISRALTQWEPRIALNEVQVEGSAEQSETAVARITYRLVATGALERISLEVPLETGSGGGN